MIRKNDFAYNKSATKQFPEGYIAILSDHEEAALPNSIFTCFRITSEECVPTFLNQLSLKEDFRFKDYGLAPKSAADFAFLLHGFHFLSDEGTMAIILPHGVLFRGGTEEAIRRKLLIDGNIDTIIGLPANLFFSTGIPVCIIVLKKCKKFDDVLFINASDYFAKSKRQNVLLDEHIDKIIETYQYRKDDDKKYSRRVPLEEIKNNDYNLNISRYVSTAVAEEPIDLLVVSKELSQIEDDIKHAKAKHNQFLRELGLPELK